MVLVKIMVLVLMLQWVVVLIWESMVKQHRIQIQV